MKIANSITLFTFGRCTPSPDWYISPTRVSRLYYIHDGDVYYHTADGKEAVLLPKHWYLLPERMNFQPYRPFDSPVDHTFFDFLSVPKLSGTEPIDLTPRAECDPIIRASLTAITLLAEKYSRSALSDTVGLMTDYLSVLLRLLPSEYFAESRISSALDYLHCHYDEDISVGTLSALLHIDENYFIRLFRRELHTTPYRYLKEYRLTKAYYALQNGASVTDVAASLRYHDTAAFSKAFRLFFGFPPSDVLRNQNGKTDVT